MSEESSSYSPSSSRSSSASSSPQKITGGLKTLKAKSGKRLAALTELEELQKTISHEAKNLAYYQRKASECLSELASLEEKKQKLLGQLEDDDDIIYTSPQPISESKNSRFSVSSMNSSGGSLSAQFVLYVNQGLREELGDGGESSAYQVKK